MSNPHEKHKIRLLNYISPEEYASIHRLMELCCAEDRINLKLELDYKLHVGNLANQNEQEHSCNKREFLYYINGELVSYLGISCFDNETGELCGMTHPDWRDRGLFGRLLSLAANELRHAHYKTLLLLSDHASESGMNYLKSHQYSYAHSEYRMKRISPAHAPYAAVKDAATAGTEGTAGASPVLRLRLAGKEDEPEITRQDALLFHSSEKAEAEKEPRPFSLEEQPENCRLLMIELNDTSIGKINIEYGEHTAFLYGFGILPEYRGRGYGRHALEKVLQMLDAQGIPTTELDVVCTNSNALHLYQSCGFEEQSVMNYYHFPLS